MGTWKVTAKQALEQLMRNYLFLEKKVQRLSQDGNVPWQMQLDLAALKYAIDVVERQRAYNVAHHENGTQPTDRMRV